MMHPIFLAKKQRYQISNDDVRKSNLTSHSVGLSGCKDCHVKLRWGLQKQLGGIEEVIRFVSCLKVIHIHVTRFLSSIINEAVSSIFGLEAIFYWVLFVLDINSIRTRESKQSRCSSKRYDTRQCLKSLRARRYWLFLWIHHMTDFHCIIIFNNSSRDVIQRLLGIWESINIFVGSKSKINLKYSGEGQRYHSRISENVFWGA